jgi:hypothetical protein
MVVRVLCARRGQELAGSAGREGYLDAAQADVEVDVVFEDEGRLKARVEEPESESASTYSTKTVRLGVAAKTELG